MLNAFKLFDLQVLAQLRKERRERQQSAAAVRVQSLLRMGRAKREMAVLQAQRSKKVAATITLQSLARQRMARKQLLALKSDRAARIAAADRVNASLRVPVARKQLTALRLAQQRKSQQQATAATRVQALARGSRARKAAAQLRAGRQQVQQLTAEPADSASTVAPVPEQQPADGDDLMDLFNVLTPAPASAIAFAADDYVHVTPPKATAATANSAVASTTIEAAAIVNVGPSSAVALTAAGIVAEPASKELALSDDLVAAFGSHEEVVTPDSKPAKPGSTASPRQHAAATKIAAVARGASARRVVAGLTSNVAGATGGTTDAAPTGAAAEAGPIYPDITPDTSNFQAEQYLRGTAATVLTTFARGVLAKRTALEMREQAAAAPTSGPEARDSHAGSSGSSGTTTSSGGDWVEVPSHSSTPDSAAAPGTTASIAPSALPRPVSSGALPLPLPSRPTARNSSAAVADTGPNPFGEAPAAAAPSKPALSRSSSRALELERNRRKGAAAVRT
jgi:hypothetical protein